VTPELALAAQRIIEKRLSVLETELGLVKAAHADPTIPDESVRKWTRRLIPELMELRDWHQHLKNRSTS
jgi:hypothetical protein